MSEEHGISLFKKLEMLEFTGTFVGCETGGEVPGVALTGVVEGGGRVEGEFGVEWSNLERKIKIIR